MMYQDKLVVAVKSNGKILRETKDLVQLPFGSEFSVLVKNLNSRRAKFRLHIDGTDVLDGTEIIVNANAEVEMKRFIRNGNMDEGNAFKFIERTQAIEDGPRGIKMDDGVIRVEFWFEKEAPVINTVYTREIWSKEAYPTFGGPFRNSGIGGSGISSSIGSSASYTTKSKSASRGPQTSSMSTLDSYTELAQTQNAAQSLNNVANEAGITVPGSRVEQKFTTVYGFNPETQSHVIVLRMIGKVGEIEVAAPVTVKTTQKCSTCGKVNKATSKFCTDCGTSLQLL